MKPGVWHRGHSGPLSAAPYCKELDMTLINLTFLILNLNYLVDHGLHAGVSLDEVKQHIRRGDVLDWLGQWFKGSVDVSPYTHDRAVHDEITRGLQELLDGYAGDERRKWGVENNGICLLIAWTAALVQQRALRDLDECSNCDGTGWVCETHADRPFKMFSKRADACECCGAGVPCQVCNKGDSPHLPPAFKAMLDDTGPRH